MVEEEEEEEQLEEQEEEEEELVRAALPVDDGAEPDFDAVRRAYQSPSQPCRR